MLENKQERVQRRALYALFVLLGMVTSSWVSRTPALRDGLQASTEQMGLILFGFSTGSMPTCWWSVCMPAVRRVLAWA